MSEWTRGGKQAVLRIYERLHDGKIGAHWLWCALEQIANGECERRVLADFGYVPKECVLEQSADCCAAAIRNQP